MSKFVVSGMRYDFPKPSNIGVSGNPLRAMNETNKPYEKSGISNYSKSIFTITKIEKHLDNLLSLVKMST